MSKKLLTMKKIFLPLFIFLIATEVQAQVQVSFSALGDADDWQLFMSKKILTDLGAGSGGKAVFITFTAGDEGLGSGGSGAVPYYLAKEKGAVYSSKFASDITLQPIYPNTYAVPTATTVVLNGKTLTKYVYGNASGNGMVVNYFLRLPDGGQTGTGFAGTGNKSLKKLKDGTITNITSVDGVNTYTWAQLVNTIKYIIFAEKGNDAQVWINTSSLSAITNPNDHSDHYYSSTAAEEAVSTFLWVGIHEFVMDNSSTLSANLTNEEFEEASAAFGLYNWNLIKNRYNNTLNSTTRAWLSMESSNVLRSPSGTAPALPVVLLSFTGALKGNNVQLDWATTSEINSKEFIIERSNDGVSYRELTRVPAAGYSSTTKKYTYLDIEATDVNYYRLKMVDLDGTSKQSDVVLIKNNSLSQAVSAVTNPFADHIGIRFAKLPKGEVALRLLDMSGKLITTARIYNPLSSVIRLDNTGSLSQGLYVLQVENEGKQYSIKLLKR